MRSHYFLIFAEIKNRKMKIDKSTTVSFILLIVIASLYRVMPRRPLGFAPQIAMALFGGATIKDKKLCFQELKLVPVRILHLLPGFSHPQQQGPTHHNDYYKDIPRAPSLISNVTDVFLPAPKPIARDLYFLYRP